jgi:anti-sigma B factor antagonist
MRTLARITEDTDGDVPVAAIDGEIDASNVRDLGHRLRDMLTNHSESLVIDLILTTYIDSAGINLLFELAAELRQRQQRLFLAVEEQSPIARMFAITGLDTAVPIHPTRDAAVRAAAAFAP